MTMLRLGFACLLLFGSSAEAARRGLNDSGACVETCSLGGGEPCPPCPPRAVAGVVASDAAERYRGENAQYESEMRAFAARNRQRGDQPRIDAARTRALNIQSLAKALDTGQ
jgi:hypothetical protein